MVKTANNLVSADSHDAAAMRALLDALEAAALPLDEGGKHGH